MSYGEEYPHSHTRKLRMVDPKTDFGDLSFLSYTQRYHFLRLIESGQLIRASTRREQIGIAMEELNSGLSRQDKFSHELLARIFEIPRSNLERQYFKYKNGVMSHGAPSIIDENEKTQLIEWLNEQFAYEDYPTVDAIIDFISEKFKKNILPNTLRKYLSTHLEDFKFVDAVPLEDVRYNVDGSDIDAYYEFLESKIAEVDFRFFFNIDETGEDEFVDVHIVRVFVPADTNPESIKIPVSRKQKRFTIIHTICTDGTYNDLYLILPRMTIESDIFTIIDKSRVRMAYQKNGFVTDLIFKDFWENWFIIQLREKRKKYNYVGLAIVIMDNHRSHHKVVGGDIDDKVTFIPEENLLIIWLVPHASEQIQPLDLGIFAIQKRETQKQKKVEDLTLFSNVILRAITGMQKASTYRNIIGAFRAAGIILKVKNVECTQFLAIDRSQARKVRHWDSYTETDDILPRRDIQLMHHNPDYPRFRILSFSGQ